MEGKWPRPWLVINKRRSQTSSAVLQTVGDEGVAGEGFPSVHVHKHLVLTASTTKKKKESKSDWAFPVITEIKVKIKFHFPPLRWDISNSDKTKPW